MIGGRQAKALLDPRYLGRIGLKASFNLADPRLGCVVEITKHPLTLLANIQHCQGLGTTFAIKPFWTLRASVHSLPEKS